MADNNGGKEKVGGRRKNRDMGRTEWRYFERQASTLDQQRLTKQVANH